jgi:hypothetical protein
MRIDSYTDLDLKLDRAAPGMEVVFIFLPVGLVGSEVYRLGEFDPDKQGWRFFMEMGGELKTLGFMPVSGKGYHRTTSKTDNAYSPDYVFSLNPKHIAQARIEKEKLEEWCAQEKIRRSKEDTKKLKEFQEKLEDLLLAYDAMLMPLQTEGEPYGVRVKLLATVGGEKKFMNELTTTEIRRRRRRQNPMK